jgi:hypothetical protein
MQTYDDPRRLGRLRVQVPDVLGDLAAWAMPCVPYAGPDAGLYTLPEPGTGVWVEFEAGNPDTPIWTGFFWQPNQLPEDESGNPATPPAKLLRTEGGLIISLNDKRQIIVLGNLDGEEATGVELDRSRIKLWSSDRVVVEAPHVELARNATHPVVLGDELLQYLNQLVSMFNTHMHPGQLAGGTVPVTPAPPVPPLPPATPALLSKKVTTE